MYLTERDFSIFKFLWRWKFATTATIYAKYFPNVGPTIPYRRLRRLETLKLIECILVSAKGGRAWRLTQKGFNLIKGPLPELKELGFKSENPDHDFLVTALHLGEWLTQRPDGVFLCSEQEMRRLHPEVLPSWVPSPEMHRPDGYWHLISNNQARTVSLEVELSRKTKDRMTAVHRFYEYERRIDAVIWVTESASLATFINNHFYSLNPEQTSKHQIVLAEDFIKYGWHAPIKDGSQVGDSIFGTLLGPCHNLASKPPQTSQPLWHPYLIDCAKRPVTSQRCKSAQIKKS